MLWFSEWPPEGRNTFSDNFGICWDVGNLETLSEGVPEGKVYFAATLSTDFFGARVLTLTDAFLREAREQVRQAICSS